MSESQYLKLTLDNEDAFYNIETFNGNFRKIDAFASDAGDALEVLNGNAFIVCSAAYDAAAKRHTLTPVQVGIVLPEVFTAKFLATASFKAGDKVYLNGVEYTPAYNDSDDPVEAGVWMLGAVVDLPCSTLDKKAFVGMGHRSALSNKVNQRGYLSQAEFDALDCDDAYTGCIGSGITGMSKPDHYNVFHMPLKGTPGYGTQLISNVNEPGTLYLRQSSKNGVWWSPIRISTAEPPQRYNLPLANGFASGRQSVYCKTQENIVHLTADIRKGGSEIKSGTTIATLPEGMRPISQTAIPIQGVLPGEVNAISCGALINTDGTIMIFTSQNIVGIAFNCTFMSV